MKVKADNARGFKIINASDFDPKVHQTVESGAKPAPEMSEAEAKALDEKMAQRKADANFGQVDGGGVASGKNPSGTFSEPTPTDVRFPDKVATEFENNFGSTIGKSAAGLREEAGLPDAPGGLKPEQYASAKADEEASALAAAQAKKAAEADGNSSLADAIADAKAEQKPASKSAKK